MAKPTPQQIKDAFEWTACWASGGTDHLDPDQSTQARRILGDNAYEVIVTTARAYGRRQAGAR